jgi:hypothetical protein
MKTFTLNPPYPNKFIAGDVAISTIDVNFCDGTKHKIGQRIVVTEKTKSYYNVWHNYYEKAQNESQKNTR